MRAESRRGGGEATLRLRLRQARARAEGERPPPERTRDYALRACVLNAAEQLDDLFALNS